MQQMLALLDPRTARLLMIAVAAIVAAALGTYVVWPMASEVLELSNTLTVLERVANRGEAMEDEIRAAELRVAELERELHGDMVDKSDNELEAFVLGRMQGISWRNDIELRSVKPSKGNRVLDFEEVRFEVQVTGDYFDLFAWLRDLNEELGFVVVKRFNLRATERNVSEPRLTATFTIVSYRGTGHA